MKCGARPDAVYSLKPLEHFKVDAISLKGATLVDSAYLYIYIYKYIWVDAMIVGTPLCFKYQATIDASNIVVDYPSNWSILLVDSGKSIWSSFDRCSVPFNECVFTRINFRPPLSKFEVALLKYLKVAPYQLQSVFWASMNMFQFGNKYRSWKTSPHFDFHFVPCYTYFLEWYLGPGASSLTSFARPIYWGLGWFSKVLHACKVSYSGGSLFLFI